MYGKETPGLLVSPRERPFISGWNSQMGENSSSGMNCITVAYVPCSLENSIKRTPPDEIISLPSMMKIMYILFVKCEII